MKAEVGISNFSLPTYYRLPSAVNVVLNVNAAGVVKRDTSQAKPKSLHELIPAKANIHTLRDGELVLYRRNRSRVWQCRFKLYDGQWQRVSTRKTTLEQAATVACDLYDEARYRVRLGLTAVQKAFADIAKITANELQRDIDAGTGKKIYVDYISIINRYFIPFFGDKYLHNIKHADIAAFERWRNDKMGRKPKSSTLMNFASAFSRVCSTAVQRGWLSDKVPLAIGSNRVAVGCSMAQTETAVVTCSNNGGSGAPFRAKSGASRSRERPKWSERGGARPEKLRNLVQHGKF